MSKRYFIFSLILAIAYCAFGQDSLVIKVSTTDCLNCYANMYSVENIKGTIAKTLVFPEISKKEMKYYAIDLMHIKDLSKYHVILSDSVYDKIQESSTSEVLVYQKNKLRERAELQQFNPYKLIHQIDTVITLPDSIVLSAHVDIEYNKSIFMITDYRFGKIILLNRKSPHNLRIIKAEDFTTPVFFKIASKTGNSYNVFKKHQQQLRFANFDKVRFDGASSSLNSLVSFVEIPVIKINNDSTIMVSPEFVIVEFVDQNNFNVYGIDKKSLPDGYYVNGYSFLHNHSNYYLILKTKNHPENTNNYFVGKFIKKGNNLIFDKFIKWNMPKTYLNEKMKVMALRPFFLFPYIFMEYTLDVYDLENGFLMKLPLKKHVINIEIDKNYKLVKDIFSYQFIDAEVAGDKIYVLYGNDKRETYLLELEKHTFKKVSLIKIETEKSTKSDIKLFDPQHLFYVTKNNSIVIKRIRTNAPF